ncbi:MAG: restriction endonuclease subunit S [Patescibacteria group bacterium]|nr:MAG: restriction endonuclease subunit S [Patescibacteria group bacterium]
MEKQEERNMKASWQIKKLGEVCDILDNKRKPITKRNRATGEYPYYGATGILDYVGDYIFDEKLVLIGEDGAKWESGERTAFIADGKYWVNNHAHVIRPHRNIILDNWIIFYFYLTDLTKHTTGLTVPKLNQANLRNIQIPLPPLPEQHRIVKILDEIFVDVAKAKENAEKNLQNAKEFFESYLQSVFVNPRKDWREGLLGDVCEVIAGQSPEGRFYNKLGKGLPFYQGKKEFKEKYIGEPTTWTTKTTKEALKNDILMSVRAPVGPINFATQKICIGRGLAIIRPRKNVDKDFIFYAILSKEKEILGNTGAVFSSINKNDIENLIFFIPPLPQQKSIVAKFDALSAETKKLEEIYKQKLADLEELKKSVLKKAFKGEL